MGVHIGEINPDLQTLEVTTQLIGVKENESFAGYLKVPYGNGYGLYTKVKQAEESQVSSTLEGGKDKLHIEQVSNVWPLDSYHIDIVTGVEVDPEFRYSDGYRIFLGDWEFRQQNIWTMRYTISDIEYIVDDGKTFAERTYSVTFSHTGEYINKNMSYLFLFTLPVIIPAVHLFVWRGKIHEDIIIFLGIIAAQVAVLAYMGQYMKDQPPGDYLHTLILPVGTVAYVLLFIIVFAVLRERLFGSNVDLQTRKEHNQTLLRVMSRLENAWIREIYDFNLEITVSQKDGSKRKIEAFEDWRAMVSEPNERMSVKNLENLDWLEAHFKHKEYRTIDELWKRAKSLVKEYNNSIPSVTSLLERSLSNDMARHFPKFVQSNDIDSPKPQNYFYLSNLVGVAFRSLNNFYSDDGRKSEFALDRHPYGNNGMWVIEKGGWHLMRSLDMELLDTERLRSVLIASNEDERIEEQVNRLAEKRKKIEQTLSELTRELRLLTRKVEGGYYMKGKCDLKF